MQLVPSINDKSGQLGGVSEAKRERLIIFENEKR